MRRLLAAFAALALVYLAGPAAAQTVYLGAQCANIANVLPVQHTGTGCPSEGSWLAGQLAVGTDGVLCYSTAAGSPGTWTDVGGGGASALDDLSDVTITSGASGEAIVWGGSGWVDGTLDGSDVGLADSPTADGEYVLSRASSTNSWLGRKNNMFAGTSPTANDDLDGSYGAGSLWMLVAGTAAWVNQYAGDGAAVWKRLAMYDGTPTFHSGINAPDADYDVNDGARTGDIYVHAPVVGDKAVYVASDVGSGTAVWNQVTTDPDDLAWPTGTDGYVWTSDGAGAAAWEAAGGGGPTIDTYEILTPATATTVNWTTEALVDSFSVTVPSAKLTQGATFDVWFHLEITGYTGSSNSGMLYLRAKQGSTVVGNFAGINFDDVGSTTAGYGPGFFGTGYISVSGASGKLFTHFLDGWTPSNAGGLNDIDTTTDLTIGAYAWIGSGGADVEVQPMSLVVRVTQ